MKARKFSVIKGGYTMSTLATGGKVEIERLTCITSARSIIQKAMKTKGLTSQQIKETFKEILHEKKS